MTYRIFAKNAYKGTVESTYEEIAQMFPYHQYYPLSRTFNIWAIGAKLRKTKGENNSKGGHNS